MTKYGIYRDCVTALMRTITAESIALPKPRHRMKPEDWERVCCEYYLDLFEQEKLRTAHFCVEIV